MNAQKLLNFFRRTEALSWPLGSGSRARRNARWWRGGAGSLERKGSKGQKNENDNAMGGERGCVMHLAA